MHHPPRRLPLRLEHIAFVGALVVALVGAPPVPASAEVPVTIMAAGDIASSVANATATGDLIRAAAPHAVLTLGDNAYSDGTAADYQGKYAPAWGSFRNITHPVPGNHDYHFVPPAGYRDYFGVGAVTNPVDGGFYYAWDVGNGWRAYAVNTEISTSAAQLTWLRNDVAAHPGMHYLLYTHHPRYTSGSNHSPSTAVCPLWNALAATGGLEIVLAGHNHQYERFAPMDCAGQQTAAGAASFVVGTGGAGLYAFGTPRPGSEFRNSTDMGVLRLDLTSTSYAWSFLASGRGGTGAAPAGRILDSGSRSLDGVPVPDNQTPAVDAGPNRTVTLPASATLDGTATDDGRPAPVTSTWTKDSGPGTVTFGTASAVDTTATFSAAGSYVLRLTASDSARSSSDTVAVTVTAPPTSGATRTADVRVARSSDDAEQSVGGSTSLTSSDLELVTDGSTKQVVGLRFTGVPVPPGATVTRAWVQFTVDEVSTDNASLTIRAETGVNAATHTSGRETITARPVMAATVSWTPSTWRTVGAAGQDQRTPDIAALVQAVVGQAGWASGNALAVQFSGTGRRTAEAYDGVRTAAPLLHVEYSTGG